MDHNHSYYSPQAPTNKSDSNNNNNNSQSSSSFQGHIDYNSSTFTPALNPPPAPSPMAYSPIPAGSSPNSMYRQGPTSAAQPGGLNINAYNSPSPTISMNPYMTIPEEATPSTRHYPHHSNSTQHYQQHSQQFSNMRQNQQIPSPSSNALKLSSHGSTSSLMSYDESANSSTPSKASHYSPSSNSHTSTNRLHFNPQSSPRLQTGAPQSYTQQQSGPLKGLNVSTTGLKTSGTPNLGPPMYNQNQSGSQMQSPNTPISGYSFNNWYPSTASQKQQHSYVSSQASASEVGGNNNVLSSSPIRGSNGLGTNTAQEKSNYGSFTYQQINSPTTSSSSSSSVDATTTLPPPVKSSRNMTPNSSTMASTKSFPSGGISSSQSLPQLTHLQQSHYQQHSPPSLHIQSPSQPSIRQQQTPQQSQFQLQQPNHQKSHSYSRSSPSQTMSAQQMALMAATAHHRLSTDNPDVYARNVNIENATPSNTSSPSSPIRQMHAQSASISSSTARPHSFSMSHPPGQHIGSPNPQNETGSYYSASPNPQSVPVKYPPSFRRIRSISELAPIVHDQPKFRRALPEGGSLSPLAALTRQLPTTYHICNPEFNYQSSRNPRRVLTKPSEGKLNHGYDNSENDYILYVNDILGIDEQRRYLVLDILGHGTFGQVAKCQNMVTKEILAVKVIKSKPAYYKQSLMEVSILQHLNTRIDENNEHNLLRLKDHFMHKDHLCLVFELLSSNLYELIKRNKFRGLSINLVRVFSQQLLDSLMVLKKANIIHCDLKPENILLKSIDKPDIKVIDFGSACHERKTVYTYIQSRFYRSPEVLLGIPYSASIDMWSLGCIVAELFLGLPIFPGTSEYNQLSRIIETLGMPPNWMLDLGNSTKQFMTQYVDEYGNKRYSLKTPEQYSKEFLVKEEPSKKYFQFTKLDDIIMKYPLPKENMSQEEIDAEIENRKSLLDFIKGLLNINPIERWTPQAAAGHPFITGQRFTGPYVPGFSNPALAYNKHVPISQQQQQQQHQQQQQQQQQKYTSYQKQHQQEYQQGRPEKGPILPLASEQAGPSQKQQIYYGMGSQAPATNSIPGALPPYTANNAASIQQKPPHPQQMKPQIQGYHGQSQMASTGWSARRPRASTIGNMDPIPQPIQRATALMNPAQPIRAQPSPAYIPPPELFEKNNNGLMVNRVRVGNSGLSNVTSNSEMNTNQNGSYYNNNDNSNNKPNAENRNNGNSNSGDVVRNLENGAISYWS